MLLPYCQMYLTSYFAVALVFSGTTIRPPRACAGRESDAGRVNHAPRLVLEDVTVVDGTGKPGIAHRDLLLDRGRICEIAIHRRNAWPGTRRLSLPGRFVVPGYIDMHEHIAGERWSMSPAGDKSARFDSSLSVAMQRVLLASGITTVRNPGSWVAPTEELIRLREQMNIDSAPGPRIVTAGRIISDPQMSPLDVRREIDAQARAGVDFVKLYSAMPPVLVMAAIEAAHQRHLPVAGHLQQTSWRAATDMGIDFIEHGASWSSADLPIADRQRYESQQGMRARISWLELVDPEDSLLVATIAGLAQHKVVVTPTLVAFQSKFWGYESVYHTDSVSGLLPQLVDDWRVLGTFTDDWSIDEFTRVRRAWPRMLALTRRMYDAGVRLTAGADVGSPWVTPGTDFHRELSLLNSVGIPPLEVLKIATRNGAEALSELDDVGTVDVGKRADLVVLRRDPAIDVGALADIEYVVRDGHVRRPEALVPTGNRLREGTILADDGVRLHYYMDGSAAKDTLIIPVGVILEPELRSLADRYTLIFYDPRGRGLSDSLSTTNVATPGPNAFERDLADLEAVRRHFRVSKPVVVGWSFYSLLAARYGVDHPATTGAVVLLSPLAPRRTPYAGLMNARYGSRLNGRERASLDSARTARRTTADSIQFCRQNAAFYVPANMASRGKGIRLHSDPCWLRNEWPEQSARASGSSFESLGDFDFRPALESMRVPMLVVHGVDDASPIEGVREWLVAPRSRLASIEGAAHWTFVEQPTLFRRAIEGFMTKQP